MSKASQIRQKAQELLSKGQMDKAIQEYKRLIGIESKNPNLFNELGDIYLRAGDRDQAVQNYDKASAIYEKVALYNNAVAVCKKVLRVVPDRAETIFKLGELRAKQKLEGEAATYFTQYLDLALASPQSGGSAFARNLDHVLELMPSNETLGARVADLMNELGMKRRAAELFVTLLKSAQARGDGAKVASFEGRINDILPLLTPEEIQDVNALKVAALSPSAGAAGASAPEEAAGEEPSAEAASNDAAAAEREAVKDGDAGAAAAETAAAAAKSARGAGEDIVFTTNSGAPLRPAARSEEAAEEEVDSDAGPPLAPEVQEAIEEAEMVEAMSRGLGKALESEAKRGAAPSGGGAPPNDIAPSRDFAHAQGESAPPMDQRSAAHGAGAPAPQGAPAAAGASAPAGAQAAGGRNLVEEITSDVEQDDLRSHYDLGMAYLEMGLFNEAIKEFQLAARAEQLQLSCIEMIGHCFLKQGNPRLAAKQLQRGLEIAGSTGAESLGIHYNLGLAHEMLGDHDKAREHFEEVYIVDMTFRDIAEKMKRYSTIP